MREPIFQPVNIAGDVHIKHMPKELLTRKRDAALLWRATNLAIESALRFGRDLPVGAVAAAGDSIIGRYFASDVRNGFKPMHAEFMAIQDTRFDIQKERPDTVVVTLEPCEPCQDFLAEQPGLKRVAFGLSRADVAAKGLVRPHDETIFSRALRVGLPYEVIQIDDPQLRHVGSLILDHTTRNIEDGSVAVSIDSLYNALLALNKTTIGAEEST